MIPIIANTAFENLCEFDDYMSFIWTNRYYSTGDFEICLPVSEKTNEFIKKDYYVRREDDDSVGIIENIQYKRIDRITDKNEMVIVTGRFLPSILGRRIIAQQTQVNGLIQNCIQTLISQNAINPSITARRIDNLQFISELSSSIQIQQQFTGKNLLEVIEGLCIENGIGFKMTLENGLFKFKLYEGVNRSYSQNINPFVVFSPDYDNLESSDYEENYKDIVTDVLVAGEGEGLARKTIWANNAVNSGLARYEIYKDARNSSTNNGEISDTVYFQQLKEEGLEDITKITKAFAGEVFFGNIKYKEDLNLGDIVTVETPRWGLHTNTRLIEVIESVNEAGEYSIVPTFGN